MQQDFLKEILTEFTSSSKYKEDLNTPFLNEKYNEIWATNDKYLLRINRNLIGGEYPINSEYQLDFQNESVYDFVLNRDELHKIISEAEYVDEEFEDTSQIKECPECGGIGEVETVYINKEGVEKTIDITCPVCGGEGEIGDVQYIKTGKKVISLISNYRFDRYSISLRHMSYVYEIMKHLNIDNAQCSVIGHYALQIHLNSDITVCLLCFVPPYEPYTCFCLQSALKTKENKCSVDSNTTKEVFIKFK